MNVARARRRGMATAAVCSMRTMYTSQLPGRCLRSARGRPWLRRVFQRTGGATSLDRRVGLDLVQTDREVDRVV
ncbi:hypothetical protein CLAFUW4_08172 [Fulvia fulva]|uniref:Uncharacterized protein n=1 Tax=Passalora fulva TaxID=5499 RepID=A0A9Q8LDI2_PASFU|nr:uncharacterized protein CLAFUR5_08286 [Fulvia fulva]KAK4629479.1 hypothetical protein CLAFUR4_08177 [Fulvia fulva]KAK4630275.1 hypothetical protein CLAFUR0_08172 [Fulvia fulva]UJO15500.1 hypothetical protein CLAFUR5_08286 [Fulvia fulva]WPV12681.1 hypothetical protein CLAFUW4_08172 [Fulvia fulva]WPV27422.1 hypothetical protein CLAFUW7_08172 [Fulvia fulva]